MSSWKLVVPRPPFFILPSRSRFALRLRRLLSVVVYSLIGMYVHAVDHPRGSREKRRGPGILTLGAPAPSFGGADVH